MVLRIIKNWITLLAIAGMIGFVSCSKAKKPNEPEEDSSSSGVSSSSLSSSSGMTSLSVGSIWHTDSVMRGDTLRFKVQVQVGHQYQIRWDDSLQGSGNYTGDIKVQVKDSSALTNYWWLSQDHGYSTTQTLIVEESQILLQVTAFRSGTFAIMVLDLGVPVSSSSLSSVIFHSSSSLSSQSSSSNPSSVTSSGVSSSTSSNSSSPSSSTSSSSSSVVPEGYLPLSRSWIRDSIDFLDSNEYRVSVIPGNVYSVQWMDFANYNYDAIQGYPSADVLVGVYTLSGQIIVSPSAVGAYPAFTATDTVVMIRVKPQTAVEEGSYYVRVFSPTSVQKNISIRQTWTLDTIEIANDTIYYNAPVIIGQLYRMQWMDNGDGTGMQTANITVAVRDSGSVTDNLMLPSDHGLSYAFYFRPTKSKIQIKVIAPSKAGRFAIRLSLSNEMKSTNPSSTWIRDTLHLYRDTITYKIPILEGESYRIQLDDYDQGAAFSGIKGDVSFRWKSSRSSLWSAVYAYAYTTPISTSIYGSDTMELQFFGDLINSSGLFSFRVYQTSITKSLSPSLNWHKDTIQGAGDTIFYKVPIVEGKIYAVQVNEYDNQSLAYSLDASVRIWSYNSSTVRGNPDVISVNTDVYPILVTGSDTLLVAVCGESSIYTGTFAIRVFERVPPPVRQFTVSREWTEDSLLVAGDTLYFKVPVTLGTSYNLQIATSQTISLNKTLYGMAQASFNRWGSLANSMTGSGYYTNMALSDTLYIRVFGFSATVDKGSFSLRVWPTLRTVVHPPSNQWLTDPRTYREGLDSLLIKVPTIPGRYYTVEGNQLDQVLPKDTIEPLIRIQVNADSTYTNPYMGRYPETVRASQDTLILILSALSPDYFGYMALRVYERNIYHERTLEWNGSETSFQDTIPFTGDSLVYRVPVTAGIAYSLTTVPNAESMCLGPMGVQYKTPHDAQWTSPVFTSMTSYTPDEDSMLVRVWGKVPNQCSGTYQISIRKSVFVKSLSVSDLWTRDTIKAGDTVYYRIPVEAGSYYRIQWDDVAQGSGINTANVKAWFKDASQAWENLVYLDGYIPVLKMKALSDTLVVRICGATTTTVGNFSVRVSPWELKQYSLPVSKIWRQDSILATDTMTYLVSALQGVNYRIHWYDANLNSVTWPADVVVWAENSSGVRYWVSNQDLGYNKHVVTPTEDSLIVKVVGKTQNSKGKFQIRIYPSSQMIDTVIQAQGASWITDTLESMDTLVVYVPIVDPGLYWYQIDDSYGSGAYTGLSLYANVKGSPSVVTSTTTSSNFGTPRLVNAMDTVVMKLYATGSSLRGAFAYRVQPMPVQNLPLSMMALTEGTLQRGDMMAYRTQVLAGYTRLIWEDSDNSSSGYTADVLVSVISSTGTILRSATDIGYATYPTASTLLSTDPQTVYLLVQNASTASIGGSYAIQAYAQ